MKSNLKQLKDDISIGLTRTIYIRCTYDIFLQGIHQTFGHNRCMFFSVLANPTYLVECIHALLSLSLSVSLSLALSLSLLHRFEAEW